MGRRYEEAFGRVLDMADVSRVTWLCKQLDATQLLSQEPLPLSQSVLLSLMQQLGSDLSKVHPSSTPEILVHWLVHQPCVDLCDSLHVHLSTDPDGLTTSSSLPPLSCFSDRGDLQDFLNLLALPLIL